MLEKLAVHHNLWLQMLNNLGCESELAKDLVQDMYLRLHRLVKDEKNIMYGDDVNKYFVYRTLMNMYLTTMKRDSKYNFTDISDYNSPPDEVYNHQEDAYFEELLDDIKDHIKEWGIYDKALFNLYFGVIVNKNNKNIDTPRSLRAVAKNANLGLSSIHISVKSYKEKLSEEFLEDIQDYFNKDFGKPK